MVTLPHNSSASRPSPASSHQAAPRRRDDVWLWIFSALLGAGLSTAAFFVDNSRDAASRPLLVFLSGLALLALWLPASGPRGQRVSLLPCVGLLSLLLLPVYCAALPLILTSVLSALAHPSLSERRLILDRGLCLTFASLAGGVLLSSSPLSSAPSSFLPTSTAALILCPALLYMTVYLGGRRLVWTVRAAGEKKTRNVTREGVTARQNRRGGRMEGVLLLLSLPVVAVTAISGRTLAGASLAAVLMGLLLLAAHFAFEVVLLREQVRAMEKISMMSLSRMTPGRVIDRFLHLSCSLVACDRSSLWLTDDSQTRLEKLSKMTVDETSSVRFGEGWVGRAADRKTPMIVRDGARDPRAEQVEHTQRNGVSYSILLLPLVAGGETVGVAQFERDGTSAFTDRDLNRVRALASQAASTIANIRMHQAVYNQAVTDPLTGLFNRRHVQTVLIDERRRAQRYGHPLSVVMLDVDSFKSYNDTYGHVQGDVLLKNLAEILRASLRSVDIIGRYGGEEFIIIMPETRSDEALLTADRLRQSVADTLFPTFADDPDQTTSRTISLGLATFPDDTDDAQRLVQLADDALYRAKRGGKNRCVLARS